MIQYTNEPELFQYSQLQAINSIVTDFISSLGYNLKIKCELINEEYSPILATTYLVGQLYLILNEPLLLIGTPHKEYEDEETRAVDLVNTILHECCHLITREGDGDFNFEKMLYDLDIISNFKEKDLQEILKLTDEEIQVYTLNREVNFENKYSKYINEFLNA